MAPVVILNVVARHVIRMIFIDGVVAQMHAGIPEIAPTHVVLDCGEPGEALLIEVDDQRVVRGHEDVQPEVGLVTIDKQRVVNILAHN